MGFGKSTSLTCKCNFPSGWLTCSRFSNKNWPELRRNVFESLECFHIPLIFIFFPKHTFCNSGDFNADVSLALPHSHHILIVFITKHLKCQSEETTFRHDKKELFFLLEQLFVAYIACIRSTQQLNTALSLWLNHSCVISRFQREASVPSLNSLNGRSTIW